MDSLNDMRKYCREVIQEYVYEYNMDNDVDFDVIYKAIETEYFQNFLDAKSKELFSDIMDCVDDYLAYIHMPSVED